ncbi:MAG: RNA polymerase sigma factor [Solirubrobacterales bacterium]|nr:RNA polymerase sigma factor [Solirubrobacterales bacterium]
MTRTDMSPCAPSTLARADDERLVALIRSGHEGAFCELHRRYRPSLERLARRLLRLSPHDPEDVLQDAFLSAYMALRAVDRPIALQAWLSMIVRNRAIDYLRQPHASRVDPDSERVLTLVPALMGDPADVAAVREEMRAVVGAIGRLPERQRLALVRRDFEGRPVREVAAGLGTTTPATWSLLFRADSTIAENRRRRELGLPERAGDAGSDAA